MSKKLSFSDFLNKEEFPFIINNGILSFPTLYSKVNNSDNLRFWEIYCILINKTINKTINITTDLFDINTFKKKFINNKDINVLIYNKYGLINGKHTITEPTVINIGKNIGRSNETNIITQALINMRSLYLKKIKSGYVINKSNIDDNQYIYPMALQTYKKFKDKLNYPCYIQPKLDGIRCIILYDKKSDKIKILSRRLHELYGFDFLKNEIKEFLGYDDHIILDGELYCHGMPLQQISGIVRNEKNNKDKQLLKFYLFDCIDVQHRLTFRERLTIMNTKFNETLNPKFIILTDTMLINNENEGDKLFKQYLKKKYEGIVYKNVNALYEYSTIKEKRSYNFLKRKNHHTEEYPIEKYTEGKGGNKGAIVFIMKTNTGKLFNVVPNATLEERKKMFLLAQKDFNKYYYGKLATIAFDDYSSDNTPLRAKFITIRYDL